MSSGVQKKVQLNYEKIFQVLKTGGDIFGASRELSEANNQLLENTRGVKNKIEDPDIKLDLMEGSRNVAREVTRILAHAKQLAPQGKPDERQLQFLLGERNRLTQHTLNM